MTPERWQQVKRLLESALELNTAERAALLDNACKDDASLRREVDSLIASHKQAGSFIEAPALEAPTRILSDTHAQSEVSPFVGSYKVIREIGHGGMGTVYLAARADEQYKKLVAIKLVRRGMDTESILSRFRHERQILASLDHPNIARLLEGGTTNGLPYFVMEHIEGQPIDEYCDSRKLTTMERLKLFRTVCSAVHYAHQNLVVHRDLKPRNILVTAEGAPKLLDFGIAKLLKPEMYAQTIAPTETMIRPMTPDYASPEQVKGQPVTTASDVYSLGVLLYELLTGHRPYRITSYTPRELERVICDQEPERPSTAINRTDAVKSADGAIQRTVSPETVSRTREGQPDKLQRRLKGDLDNIILMAMRKEPQRRYASVEQFSEDIRRHLEGLPVIARKDTFPYRASKFIRRNRIGVVVAAAFAVLMISSIIAIALQSVRAARERDKAKQVSAFLTDIFKVSDPSEARGKTITAREILDKGAARIESELKDQPEVQATLMNTIGMVYDSLGLYDTAIPLFEKALSIRRGLFGYENLDVAEIMNNLAVASYDKSDIAAAEPLFREALAMRRKLLSNEHPDVAKTLSGLGELLDVKGEYEESESVCRQALAMRRKLLGNEHKDVAESLNSLGWALYRKGDYEESERLFREALTMHRKLLGNDHPLVANDLNRAAFVLDKKGDLKGQEALYREVLAMRRKIFGDENLQVAESLNNLAFTLNRKGNIAEAESLYREALAMQRKIIGGDSIEVARSLGNVARVLMRRSDYQEAEPMLREALATYRRVEGDMHPDTALGLHNLALLLYEKRDYAGAEPLFRQALDLRRQKLPKGNPVIAATLVGLGELLTDRDNSQEAEPLLREAVEIRRNKLSEEHWQTAEAKNALGGCLTALGRYDEAEPLLVDSYPILKTNRGEQDKQTQRALDRLISLYRVWGKPDKLARYHASNGKR